VVPCLAGLLAAFAVTSSTAASDAGTSQPKLSALSISAHRAPSVRVAQLQWLRRRGIDALVVNASALSQSSLAKLGDRAAHAGMFVVAARGSLRPGACPGANATVRTCAVIASTPREAARLARTDRFDFVVFYAASLRQIDYLRGLGTQHSVVLAIVSSKLATSSSGKLHRAVLTTATDRTLALAVSSLPAASHPGTRFLTIFRRWYPLQPRKPHTNPTPSPTPTPSPAPPTTTTTSAPTPPPPTTTTVTTTPVTTTTPTDTQAPSVPTGLAVTGSSATALSLKWNASTDNVGVSGYDLSRNGTAAGTTNSTTTTFSGLTCGTSYTLGVDAYDAAGHKSAAATLVASTSACADTQAPTTPSGLFVTAGGATSISLSWSPSFDNVAVTGYGLYVGSTRVTNSGNTLTSYTFSGLACGTSYTLSVDAYDAAGNRSGKASVTSSTSPCSDTTPPSQPTGLATSGATQTAITLSWSASSDASGVSGYRLYQGTSQVGTSTSTSYQFTGLTCGTSYTLGVAAYDGAGNASGTATASGSTSACPTNTPSSTANVYLSPSGNDSTCARGDGTKPCATFDRAYHVAQCGDVVQVSGSFNDNQQITYDSSKNCSAGSPVTYVPAPGQTVFDYGLSLNGASYVTVDGQSRWNQGWFGANPSLTTSGIYATYDTFKNMTNDSGNDALTQASNWNGNFFNSVDHLTIQNVVFNDTCCSSDTLDISMRNQTDRNVSNISLIGNTFNGAQSACSLLPPGDRSACTAAGKTNDGTHVDCIQFYGGATVQIVGNYFNYCDTSYIMTGDADATSAFSNWTIENNMFGCLTESNNGVDLTDGSIWSGYIKVINNTFADDGCATSSIPTAGGGALLLKNGNGAYPSSMTATIANNIGGMGNLCALATGLTIAYSHNMFGSNGTCGSTDIAGSASFVNNSLYAPDLHLASGTNTPVDAGDDSLCPPTDIDGQARPNGAHCDIGADER
jgi:chitodextrinase